MAVNITAGNTDDRKFLQELVKNLKGKLVGDKGYIAQIAEELIGRDLNL
jgi:hypothetical protein